MDHHIGKHSHHCTRLAQRVDQHPELRLIVNQFKKPLIILGIMAGVSIIAIISFVGLGSLFLFFAKDLPITDRDRELLVTVHDIAPYYEDFEPSAEFEIFNKERYFDASQELTYEYDSPRDDEPYISVTITHERKRSDAMLVYSVEWSAQKLGLNIYDQNFNLVEDNAFYTVGEASRFGHIKLDGATLGHVLVTRKNNSIYCFTISGYTIDDPDIWHELFDEKINQFSTISN